MRYHILLAVATFFIASCAHFRAGPEATCQAGPQLTLAHSVDNTFGHDFGWVWQCGVHMKATFDYAIYDSREGWAAPIQNLIDAGEIKEATPEELDSLYR